MAETTDPDRPRVRPGDRAYCPYCHGAAHTLMPCYDPETGEVDEDELYFVCHGENYIGAINGRLRPDLFLNREDCDHE